MNFNFSNAQELLQQCQDKSSQIDFSNISALAMESIEDVLDHFIPGGELQGCEYVAYNPTRNDGELGSFKFNTKTGKWSDFATDDRGGDIVSYVKYAGQYETQRDAALAILGFLADESATAGARVSTDPAGSIIPRPSKVARRSDKDETIVMPIPDEAMHRRPAFFGSELGSPAMVWEYRDETGRSLFYQQRFDTSTGKQFRPLSYWQDSTGWGAWKSALPPVPRPAYGLDRLAARPDAPVLFAEGEKAADAAQRLFPNFVAVTTLNGANSPDKTDFNPFRGRQVYIAPDNDDAGKRYAQELVALLGEAGAMVKGVLRLELLQRDDNALPKGYDLADAEADCWTTDALARLGGELWGPIVPATEQETEAMEPSVLDGGTASASKTASKHSSKSGTAKKQSLALQAALAFAGRHFNGHLVHANSQFRAYDKGCWDALDLTFDIKRRLMDDLGDAATGAAINEAAELLRISRSTKETDSFDQAPRLICLNNGTLDPMEGVLLPHSPDHCLMNRLDIEYDPNAKCPLWQQILSEIFRPDGDIVERIQFLQEFMGYCLIPDTSLHKFLWLVGAGGNGKSLLLSVLGYLVGQHNISHAAIERLEDPNVRAELQGKLVNISAEMSAKATVSDGYLKQVVSGDWIEAERKFEKPFAFKPFTRLIGATNVLPRLLDHTDGFARRAVILRLNRQFSETEQDHGLETKLKAELPGILNWALAGLRRLLDRGRFVIPPSALQEVQRYRVNSDPVQQFAEMFLVQSESEADWSGGQWLYEQYRDWARGNGYQPCANNQFSERLIALGFEKVKTRNGRLWKATYFQHKDLELDARTSKVAPISALATRFAV